MARLPAGVLVDDEPPLLAELGIPVRGKNKCMDATHEGHQDAPKCQRLDRWPEYAPTKTDRMNHSACRIKNTE